MNFKSLVLFGICIPLVGCNAPQPPNPNDPNQVSAARQPFVINDYMEQMSRDVAGPAVANHNITDAQGRQLIAAGAQAYLKGVHLKDTPPSLLWMVAGAFVTAQEWPKAEDLLQRALKVDSGPERKVTDTLRLARCQAELGEVTDAIKTARSAFDAPPEWKWPILYAVYLEIVPAAVRTKPDERIALAHLVEDAIAQHKAATGSIVNDSQRAWVVSRPIHIQRAWSVVEQLYKDAGKPELAIQAAKKATKDAETREPMESGVSA